MTASDDRRGSLQASRAGLRPLHALSLWRTARVEARRCSGAEGTALGELLARITGATWSSGNSVCLFFDGATATAAMLRALAGAEREILLESYIFADDDTGRELRQGLVDAARRGVAVRVLADAFGSLATSSSFWGEMRESGIETRQFHPLFASLAGQRYRDHRKILVVDRRIAFTGGMNVADEYASFRRGAVIDLDSMRDTHVRIEGPAAWEMAALFSEGWGEAGGEPLAGSPRPGGRPGGTRVLVLASRPQHGYLETAAALAAIVGAAREEVWVTVGYFAPHRHAVDVLCDAAKRGLDVRLLLPGRSDVPLARHAGHSSFAGLLSSGVRIYEYQSAVLHAKTMVADRRVSVIGSSNLDARSFRYNAECNLVLLDHDCGERLAAAFARDLEDSVEVDLAQWERRNALHRVADEAAGLLTPVL
jgi:cardiolipin synthase A/B